MMRLSVSVPFCVHLLSMHMRDIRDSVKHLCHSPNLPDIVTGRAWRWRSDGGLARYRGTRSAVLQTAETELPRSEEWLAPSRAHPQTRTGPDARSVRLLLVHHLRADTGAQHEHQNGPEYHEQHHAEGGQHLSQRVLERLMPELSRRQTASAGFATGRGQGGAGAGGRSAERAAR